jgi:hypothetical protein
MEPIVVIRQLYVLAMVHAQLQMYVLVNLVGLVIIAQFQFVLGFQTQVLVLDLLVLLQILVIAHLNTLDHTARFLSVIQNSVMMHLFVPVVEHVLRVLNVIVIQDTLVQIANCRYAILGIHQIH